MNRPEALQLPDQGHRVESGNIRFGDDWTGVFFRGDHAFGFLMMIISVLQKAVANEPIPRVTCQMLTSYGENLVACIEDPELRADLNARLKNLEATTTV